MYSEEDIDDAVTDGVLTGDVAREFRGYIEKKRNTHAVDEEQFRFIQGFNDVFVSIASALFLACLPIIFNEVSPLISCIAVAFVSWVLAEYFTKVRRMALTSILLVIAYLIAGLSFPLIIFNGDSSREWYSAIYVGVFVSIMAFVHWRRFGVPITLACILGSLSYGIYANTAINHGADTNLPGSVAVLCGVLVLAVAVFWDASDRERITKKSDVAFWLHLAASPLIVHGAFSYLDVFYSEATMAGALAVVALYLFLALVSISLDRRALMVSSILYVLVIFTKLFEQDGEIANGFAYTGIVIGSGLLVLSAFWLRARTFVLEMLPVKLRQFIPE